MNYMTQLKYVTAEPMTRADYNVYRGWELPEDENGDDTGYKITHESGRESWSPTKDFESDYTEQ
ncbi:MAG: hypothetical protein DRP93_08140 [Candidatus Neomarinimicrobiota bacterium]|nr:MAG: hypothetical protein DRP93_08140 [Candidatus Neomarinimicrobiota bacterium]